MLWNVVGTPHKFLGSMHVLPKNYELPSWASNCHAGVDRIVFEADHRDPSIGQVGIDPSGAHLDHPGAASLYALASQMARAVGRHEPFDACRPWRAAFHLMSCLLPTFGLFHEHGMENRLRVHTDTYELETGFLEPPPRAFELVDAACAPRFDGLGFLEYIVATAASGEGKAELLRILRSWVSCDTTGLASIQAEKLRQFPYLYESLISRRNSEWLSSIRGLVTDSAPTLIVVGSLHLVGPEGLISQLEKDGYRFDGPSKK